MRKPRQQKRYRLPRGLDKVEWNVIMGDGAKWRRRDQRTDEDVENAIAYLEAFADWIFSSDVFCPCGPFEETRLVLDALTKADRVLHGSYYGTVRYYLEAAAILRDGWMPSWRGGRR